ncbi:hypothetical protein EBZ39_07540, partial [bacterium]|nr:hypothetical protein [bacterium]
MNGFIVVLPDGEEIEVDAKDNQEASSIAKKYLQKKTQKQEAEKTQKSQGNFQTAVMKTGADFVEAAASIPDIVTGVASAAQQISGPGMVRGVV